ncbi:MAG: histidine phosphatase family protein [Acidobacteriota bacterium]|nr:histidine phosphatase family protein [Acidobacteriota bacterium]
MTRGNLWLVRHGETEWSAAGRHTSATDLALTPEGERKAAAVGRMLAGKQFALVLASPLLRALETCRLAGYSAALEPDLHEWNYGAYEGLTTAQIQIQNPHWTIWTGTPPGGESAAEVAARGDRVIARAVAAGGDVALFGHGHMLRVLAARWLGLEPTAGRWFALSTGSIGILGYEREARVLQLWNRTE